MKGTIFGQLEVIEKFGKDKGGNITWLCICNCGELVESRGYCLKRGTVCSCGCLRRKPVGHKYEDNYDHIFFESMMKNTTLENECLVWNGALTSTGYARVCYRGKCFRAHRLVMEKKVGPIPKGKLVLHKCDNSKCINIDHLRVGTHQDNMTDKKNRNRQCKGSKRPLAKLDEDKVIMARSMSKNGCKVGVIASIFGVSHQSISKAINRDTWKHI